MKPSIGPSRWASGKSVSPSARECARYRATATSRPCIRARGRRAAAGARRSRRDTSRPAIVGGDPVRGAARTDEPVPAAQKARFSSAIASVVAVWGDDYDAGMTIDKHGALDGRGDLGIPPPAGVLPAVDVVICAYTPKREAFLRRDGAALVAADTAPTYTLVHASRP